MKIKLLNKAAKAPIAMTDGSAGIDLCSTKDYLILPGMSEIISTGIAIQLPPGFFGLLTHRSSIAFKADTVSSLGVIDNDYRGELKIKLFHHGVTGLKINKGDRIAQLLVLPYSQVTIEVVESLDETIRADGGFGSTGL